MSHASALHAHLTNTNDIATDFPTSSQTNANPAGLYTNSGAQYTITSSGATTTLDVTAGTVTLTSDFAAEYPDYDLAIGSGADVVVTAPQTVGQLQITGGTLDVGYSSIFIDYGSGADPISNITSYVKSGFNGGSWNGAGIISSAASTNKSYAVGYADSADTGNPAGLPAGEIEIRYTLLGDANLDGVVNGTDFGIVASHMGQGVSAWDEGNFNYAGVVSGSNFVAMAANFGRSINESTVTLSTRYGDELVVNATGTDDTVTVSENADIFTINADGINFTDAATAGGLFIYTRGGTDTINIASSVVSPATLETIDGAPTTIDSAGADVTAWIDSTDVYSGTGSVHSVASFAGGVSKAYGAALADPSDAGATMTVNASLFGTGPVAADANQGASGDCFFIASLAAFAQQDPNVLVQSAVDMGDGTYVVQFMSLGTPTYVRVSNQFSTGSFDGFMYAHPGSDGSIWASVMEKAFCFYRTGTNTYASIASGWMGEVYGDFGLNSEEFVPTALAQSILYSTLSTDLTDGDAITLGTPASPPDLVGDHAYSLVSVYESDGTMYFVVRNPWGFSGDSLENSQGIATLTYAQFCANFEAGCIS
jgi:Calpain family cysteine protease